MTPKITRPSLLLDREKCVANIRRMSAKASAGGVTFRPHFKTHQSAAVGEWFRETGVTRITVSSPDMARYFADNGWDDITIAFPPNLLLMEEIRSLSEEIRLNLLVSSARQVPLLVKGGFRGGLFLKIDAGYHRAGLEPQDLGEIRRILGEILSSGQMEFKGLLSHFGNTYSAGSPEGVKTVYSESMERLIRLRDSLSEDFGPIPVSIGDTPSCSVVDDLSAADEIRPGNFVFYDVMQAALGSCLPDEIAVCLAAPVVEVNRARNEAVVHAGAIHLSKEKSLSGGSEVYGLVVRLGKDGWSAPLPGAYVSALSQEHGVLALGHDPAGSFRPGDLAGILPVHSCLAVSAMRFYTTLSGEQIRCFDPQAF